MLDRLAVRACFGGSAPEALVAQSDGARFYLESMRLGERLLEPVGDRVILGAVRENTCVDYEVWSGRRQPAGRVWWPSDVLRSAMFRCPARSCILPSSMSQPQRSRRSWKHGSKARHVMSPFLPYVAARDAWLFEGLPTYLQNVLMARGGATSVEEAWQRMQSGFQRGARTASDLSLARASERIGHSGIYQRVYWAGAALMLAADLRLRSRTGGQQSLDTALEKLSRCCASGERRWNAQEIIDRLDEVTGTTVFSELVRAQFDAEGFPDYEALLARAGVKVEGTQVQFDASAPWAAERDALMRPPAIAPR